MISFAVARSPPQPPSLPEATTAAPPVRPPQAASAHSICHAGDREPVARQHVQAQVAGHTNASRPGLGSGPARNSRSAAETPKLRVDAPRCEPCPPRTSRLVRIGAVDLVARCDRRCIGLQLPALISSPALLPQAAPTSARRASGAPRWRASADPTHSSRRRRCPVRPTTSVHAGRSGRRYPQGPCTTALSPGPRARGLLHAGQPGRGSRSRFCTPYRHASVVGR